MPKNYVAQNWLLTPSSKNNKLIDIVFWNPSNLEQKGLKKLETSVSKNLCYTHFYKYQLSLKNYKYLSRKNALLFTTNDGNTVYAEMKTMKQNRTTNRGMQDYPCHENELEIMTILEKWDNGESIPEPRKPSDRLKTDEEMETMKKTECLIQPQPSTKCKGGRDLDGHECVGLRRKGKIYKYKCLDELEK